MSQILLVEFKKSKKQPEAYTSVPGFLERYPLYNENAINYRISRLKKPFEDKSIKITRISLYEREKA